MKKRAVGAVGRVWAPTRETMRHIERQARMLRERANVSDLDVFDPRALVNDLGIMLVQPQDIKNLEAAELEYISHIDPKTWSGMGKVLPDGRVLVILNPGMTIERERVTIMEEVAHAHYGHQPSQLVLHPTGFDQRKYDDYCEQEAYWTAGATLISSTAVALAMRRGETAEELAIRYETSVELAEMRVKTLRLWSQHQANTVSHGATRRAS